MLFLSEGRTGKAREPSKKLWSLGIREHWIEKYFHLGLKGYLALSYTTFSEKLNPHFTERALPQLTTNTATSAG